MTPQGAYFIQVKSQPIGIGSHVYEYHICQGKPLAPANKISLGYYLDGFSLFSYTLHCSSIEQAKTLRVSENIC